LLEARGKTSRGSTQETKAARAAKVAGLKLAQAVEGIDPLPSKAAVLVKFSRRFLDGWTMSDWKTKQKPTTAMAGGF
jgi:hypothetical protein